MRLPDGPDSTWRSIDTMTIGKRTSLQLGNENIFIPGVQDNLNPVNHDIESFFWNRSLSWLLPGLKIFRHFRKGWFLTLSGMAHTFWKIAGEKSPFYKIHQKFSAFPPLCIVLENYLRTEGKWSVEGTIVIHSYGCIGCIFLVLGQPLKIHRNNNPTADHPSRFTIINNII